MPIRNDVGYCLGEHETVSIYADKDGQKCHLVINGSVFFCPEPAERVRKGESVWVRHIGSLDYVSKNKKKLLKGKPEEVTGIPCYSRLDDD
jgi:hypothetical protein